MIEFPLVNITAGCEAGTRIKFVQIVFPTSAFCLQSCSPRQDRTRLFDLNVAEDDDDKTRKCRSTQQSWPSSRRRLPRVESVRVEPVVILNDTGAMIYYLSYYPLFELHAYSPSLFSTFCGTFRRRRFNLFSMNSSGKTPYAICLCWISLLDIPSSWFITHPLANVAQVAKELYVARW